MKVNIVLIGQLWPHTTVQLVSIYFNSQYNSKYLLSLCHYDRGFRPFAGQANVSNPVFRREQVRKRLGSKLEEKRKVKLAKLKYRIYRTHFEKVSFTCDTDGKQKYCQCPIHILVFMTRLYWQ